MAIKTLWKAQEGKWGWRVGQGKIELSIKGAELAEEESDFQYPFT